MSLLLVIVLVVGAFGVIGTASAQDDERTLNILYWQAPSTLNVFLSGGTKEIHAASLVLEPLARYDQDGNLVPYLATEIPTLENGGISEDLTTITWNLRDDIVWSDGTPFTADDVVFSWEFCTNPELGCSQVQNFNDVENVEAVDDHTVLITFGGPKPFPYGPFVGAQSPIFQRAQFQDCVGADAQSCTEENFNPIGTGPYVVEEFRPNDVITYVVNENYRDFPEKPFFTRVNFKGGGDAESAARAVLETGEFDYAWNLQVEFPILQAMEANGIGTIISGFGTSVERLIVNQTNPNPDLGDLRSVFEADGSNAHPFLTDPAVYRALSMAIDRNVMAEQLYGPTGRATCNVLPAPAIYASTNNDSCLVQDIEGANALLDEAGIVDTDGDGIREKDGVPLRILYQTSTNALRQNEQALIKQWWSEIGVDTELRNIDASVFFGGDPASPDTYQKFYADIEMYTNNFDGTDPESYMSNWACNNIPGPDTGWLGNNIQRSCDPEYDALVEQMARTADLEDRAALAIQMNDMIVQNGWMIPLIHRGAVSARRNDLEGVLMNVWDSELWNIADWTRAS
ncbi:MAG: peptide ABC transporter substrate-binding protein [Chloroflexi bacterium]|nr:MAG: peptide ABC transporter [Phototrophicales bacterium]RMF77740.1 MAG: peptide ABC transporter substrate-binding protein [Chloroflexota bacterium]